MLLSRRSTLVSASAIAATSLAPVPSLASALRPGLERPGASQSIQHLVVHADEADGQPHSVSLSLAAGDTAWISAGNIEEQTFASASDRFAARGYGLRRLNAFQTRGGVRYAAIWQLGRPTPSKVLYGMTLSQFQSATALYAKKGCTLAHVDAAATNSGARFAAIWETPSTSAQQIFAGLTQDDLAATRTKLATEGFRVQQIAGYAPVGGAHFAAVFTAGDVAAQQSDTAIAASQFRLRYRAMTAQGYTLRDASGYVAGGQPIYTAVWEKA